MHVYLGGKFSVEKVGDVEGDSLDKAKLQLRKGATVALHGTELTERQFHNSNGCRHCADGVPHHWRICSAGILSDIGRFSVL